MLLVQIDQADFIKKMQNIVKYSNGFLDGIELNRLEFERILAGYTVAALEKYIDARARMNPEALHHVYEFNAVGESNSRLFKFNTRVTSKNININGSFLPSRSIASGSREPFVNKAEIMEKGISITIAPRGDKPLAFEDQGEMVFTRATIIIDHPGGEQVAGSFGRVVDDFFTNYFSNALLQPLLKQLKNPKEYEQYLSSGAKGGKMVGVRAGRKYFTLYGGIDEFV